MIRIHPLSEVMDSPILGCVIIAWALAQLLKVPTYWFVEKRLNWRRAFEAGGMPSSHTASAVSLSAMVGALEGYNTPAFAICLVLSCIVMYDGTHVRRETGHQGAVINEILRKVFVDGQPISDDDLKEIVGHTPLEVFFGFLLGIAVALVYLQTL